jgi:hypothetical protein
MTINSTKFALVLAGTMALAAPLALSPAAAAPHGGGMMGGAMMGGRHLDAMHDHGHRPTPQHENRPLQPHGNYRWRAGAWNWSGDHWAWAPGVYIRF